MYCGINNIVVWLSCMTHQPHLNSEDPPSIESLILDIEAQRLNAEARRVEAARMAQATLAQERQAEAAREQRRARLATFFRADARHAAGILNARGAVPAQRYGPEGYGTPLLWHIATLETFDWTTPSKWVVTKKAEPRASYGPTRSDDMSSEFSYDEGFWTEPMNRHAEEQLGLSQDGQVHFLRVGDEAETGATGARLRLATDGDIWTLMSRINSGRSLDDPAIDHALVVGWRRLLAGVIIRAQGNAGSQG
jgi:hypothetical protein